MPKLGLLYLNTILEILELKLVGTYSKTRILYIGIYLFIYYFVFSIPEKNTLQYG